MENKDKPAYPLPLSSDDDGNLYHVGSLDAAAIGLTKREAFAMAAMQGLLSNSFYAEKMDGNIEMVDSSLAKRTLEIADELLKQLGE